jgi:hypothetical protein
MLLFQTFGSAGSGAILFSVLTPCDIGSMVKVRRREYHEARMGGLAKGGSSLCFVEGLAWCSGLHNSGMKVGATTHVKFKVLPFRMKTQDRTLTGCVWQ